MLGLPNKNNQPDTAKAQAARRAAPRRTVRYTLVPTLVGSMMIMMPRRESDGAPEDIQTIPSLR